MNLSRRIYYRIRPFLPRLLQVRLRQILTKIKLEEVKSVWPIDKKSGKCPNDWKGWPDGKKFAFVLTHDVDTFIGANRYRMLADIEENMGFRSSFNFVPERYPLPPDLPTYLREKKFEVGVHGLYHDGKLYSSENEFLKRAEKINAYLNNWNAVGFRSPAMHHNLKWIHNLNIEYDSSTFDTDPFEPQPDGVGTIYPFYVKDKNTENGYIELPYTLPQDFTIFVLLKQKTARIWEKKLDWIAERGGMALINTHPDYMNFGNNEIMYDEYPSDLYFSFLEFVQKKYKNDYWQALPKEVARFYKSKLSLSNEVEKK